MQLSTIALGQPRRHRLPSVLAYQHHEFFLNEKISSISEKHSVRIAPWPRLSTIIALTRARGACRQRAADFCLALFVASPYGPLLHASQNAWWRVWPRSRSERSSIGASVQRSRKRYHQMSNSASAQRRYDAGRLHSRTADWAGSDLDGAVMAHSRRTGPARRGPRRSGR